MTADTARHNSYCWLAILFVASAIVTWLTYSEVWTLDNTHYQYSFADGRRVHTVTDVIASINAHYAQHNGRYVAHVIVQLSLGILGKGCFAIANGLMFGLLIWAIVKCGRGSLQSLPTVATAALLTMVYADTDYSPTCQVGYIWMGTLSLVFILMYDKAQRLRPRGFKAVISACVLAICSAIIGNGHEAISIGIGGALLIKWLPRVKVMSAMQWAMAVGYGIGLVMLCLAPSNLQRAEMVHTPFVYSILILITNLRTTYIAIVVAIYVLATGQTSLRRMYTDNQIAINSMLILLVFNLVLGISSNRQVLGIEMMACVLTLGLLPRHALNKALILIGTLCVTAIYAIKYAEIRRVAQTIDQLREKMQDSEGVLFVDLPTLTGCVHPTPQIDYSLGYLMWCLQIEGSDSLPPDVDLIKVYPVEAQGIWQTGRGNYAIEYGDGRHILVQDADSPATFRLHRKVSLLGLEIGLAPVDITRLSDDYPSTPTQRYMYLQPLPMIKNTQVEVINDK